MLLNFKCTYQSKIIYNFLIFLCLYWCSLIFHLTVTTSLNLKQKLPSNHDGNLIDRSYDHVFVEDMAVIFFAPVFRSSIWLLSFLHAVTKTISCCHIIFQLQRKIKSRMVGLQSVLMSRLHFYWLHYIVVEKTLTSFTSFNRCHTILSRSLYISFLRISKMDAVF